MRTELLCCPSRAYERTSLVVTTNLPFEAWTEVCGSEWLTGAILDRLTHRVHILEANGESYRLRDSKRPLKARRGQAKGIDTPCRAGYIGTGAAFLPRHPPRFCSFTALVRRVYTRSAKQLQSSHGTVESPGELMEPSTGRRVSARGWTGLSDLTE